MKNILILFYESIIKSIFISNIKIVILFLLGLIRIKRWNDIFNRIEYMKSQNRVSFFKTIYFNYRSLPFSQAKNLPIHVYTNTQLISTKGSIVFEDSHVSYGMIKWGWFHSYRSQGKTRIQNCGKIIFKGKGKIMSGSEIVTWPNSTLTICDSFFIGENVLLYCQHNIYLSRCVRISYQCDISDSDYHYCIDVISGKVFHKNKSIYIGAYNWIGNRTSIKKGSRTPDYIMVASAGSVLSKDYIPLVKPYSILGGCPAKVIKTGISRIWYDELNTIAYIDAMFEKGENPIFDADTIQKYITI